MDLFFVLSGYLIGSQLLRPMRSGKPLQLGEFYRRRAFRILPAFLVTLGLYAVWPAWREGNGLSPWWMYLTFTNNLLFHYPQNSTFSHVWSLCVEEHFYLLLPWLVLLLAKRPSATKTVTVLVGVLLFGVAVRSWLLVTSLRPAAAQGAELYVPYLRYVYYPTYSRLDGLLAGVSLALLEVFRPERWARLSRYSNGLSVAGVTLTGGSLWMFRNHFESATGMAAASTVVGYPLLSAGLMLLVGSATMEGGWLARAHVPGARWLATIAFSLYLTHKELAHVLHVFWPRPMEAHPAQSAVVMWLLCVAVGTLLYVTVERPFLQLREGRVPRVARDAERVAHAEPAL